MAHQPLHPFVGRNHPISIIKGRNTNIQKIPWNHHSTAVPYIRKIIEEDVGLTRGIIIPKILVKGQSVFKRPDRVRNQVGGVFIQKNQPDIVGLVLLKHRFFLCCKRCRKEKQQ